MSNDNRDKESPLISVIVPIYMIDRYLGICIESIVNQTYKNLEIILVDDGGNDRCPEICDLYAEKDHRIKVIHKINGGLVSARKAGLRESSGEFISYVDGDDWIGPGFIEALYSSAKSSNADVVCAGFTRDLFSSSAHFTNDLPTGIYEGDKLELLWKSMISNNQFFRPGINTYLWNKLFKREIIFDPQNMVDNRISIGEDGAVSYAALYNSKIVSVVDNVAYHYRQREDSMLKKQADYAYEATKIKCLYDYLMKWASKTDTEHHIKEQVIDYVLSIAIMRSGGRIPGNELTIFDNVYYQKNVVVYSAGTFGQQLMNRLKESNYCHIVSWLDDDYWEYRRCCLDVDPVETITKLSFEYVLIATVDSRISSVIKKRLLDYGISEDKILTVTAEGDREQLLDRFLDFEKLNIIKENKNGEAMSHA